MDQEIDLEKIKEENDNRERNPILRIDGRDERELSPERALFNKYGDMETVDLLTEQSKIAQSIIDIHKTGLDNHRLGDLEKEHMYISDLLKRCNYVKGAKGASCVVSGGKNSRRRNSRSRRKSRRNRRKSRR